VTYTPPPDGADPHPPSGRSSLGLATSALKGGEDTHVSTFSSRILVVTPTKLNTYQRCPLQYRLRYVDRVSVEEPFSRSLETAHATHVVLGQAFSLFSYDRAFPVNIRDRVESVLVAGDYPEIQMWLEDVELVERWVKVALEWFDGHANVLDVERDYSRLVPRTLDHPKFVLQAKLDLLLERRNGELEIVDFKTGKSSFVDVLQNAVTRILVSKTFPNRAVRNTVVFVSGGKIYSEIIERDTLFETAEEIKRLVRGMATDTDWEPQMNPLCGYCPYAEQCPLFGGDGQNGETDWLDGVAG
jgi:putative RecB family exonuclease